MTNKKIWFKFLTLLYLIILLLFIKLLFYYYLQLLFYLFIKSISKHIYIEIRLIGRKGLKYRCLSIGQISIFDSYTGTNTTMRYASLETSRFVAASDEDCRFRTSRAELRCRGRNMAAVAKFSLLRETERERERVRSCVKTRRDWYSAASRVNSRGIISGRRDIKKITDNDNRRFARYRRNKISYALSDNSGPDAGRARSSQGKWWLRCCPALTRLSSSGCWAGRRPRARTNGARRPLRAWWRSSRSRRASRSSRRPSLRKVATPSASLYQGMPT